jgi:hypothetical protein
MGMNSKNHMEQLIEVYNNYKEKKYSFGFYKTIDEIREEFLNGKAFVLKGGLRRGDWALLIITSIIGLILLISASFFHIGLALAIFLFWIFWPLLLLLKLRMVLVISSMGVYYQRSISKGFFLWKNVRDIEGKVKVFEHITVMRVNLYLRGVKISFESRPYLIQEYPKGLEQKMFFSLFKVPYDLKNN